MVHILETSAGDSENTVRLRGERLRALREVDASIVGIDVAEVGGTNIT